jgi:hypothetical protein
MLRNSLERFGYMTKPCAHPDRPFPLRAFRMLRNRICRMQGYKVAKIVELRFGDGNAW